MLSPDRVEISCSLLIEYVRHPATLFSSCRSVSKQWLRELDREDFVWLKPAFSLGAFLLVVEGYVHRLHVLAAVRMRASNELASAVCADVLSDAALSPRTG